MAACETPSMLNVIYGVVERGPVPQLTGRLPGKAGLEQIWRSSRGIALERKAPGETGG
jgi:hypothetical protein